MAQLTHFGYSDNFIGFCQKVLLALRNVGGEAAWRSLLDDMIARGLAPPDLLIIDVLPGWRRLLSPCGPTSRSSAAPSTSTATCWPTPSDRVNRNGRPARTAEPQSVAQGAEAREEKTASPGCGGAEKGSIPRRKVEMSCRAACRPRTTGAPGSAIDANAIQAAATRMKKAADFAMKSAA